MKSTKRTGMRIEENDGQWHEDVERLHTYGNSAAWTIVFTSRQGHYDSALGICVKNDVVVEVMPTRAEVLNGGIVAFTGNGPRANLVMRNVAT